jgi:uncharacterized repeat protein (TIGR01451 family)
VPCIPYEDEYLCDGGDREAPVDVMPDWTVYGLDTEDTIAHFDTLDGRTEVEASNRVCMYAPRFASVRQVTGLIVNRQRTSVAGFELPVHLNSQEALGGPTIMNQPLQPGRYVGARGIQQFREQLRGNDLANAQAVAGIINRFKAFEDLQLIRNGQFDNTEKARLSEGMTAALVWTADQGVQVCIGDLTLIEVTGDSAAQSVCRYDLPPGKPRMRVVKVASKRAAQPGDEVEFTIRFDNVGDEVVGNVTIIDNLTARLAYVPDSAECTRDANFIAEENESGSLILRWEIIDPIEVGEGGIIRFTCRVR